jgi:hypothetical protein
VRCLRLSPAGGRSVNDVGGRPGQPSRLARDGHPRRPGRLPSAAAKLPQDSLFHRLDGRESLRLELGLRLLEQSLGQRAMLAAEALPGVHAEAGRAFLGEELAAVL